MKVVWNPNETDTGTEYKLTLTQEDFAILQSLTITVRGDYAISPTFTDAANDVICNARTLRGRNNAD